MSIHAIRPTSVDAERSLVVAEINHGNWSSKLINQMVPASDVVMESEYWDGLAIMAPNLDAIDYRTDLLYPAWRKYIASKN